MNTATKPKPAPRAVIDLRDAWRTSSTATQPLDEPLDFGVPEDLAARIRSHLPRRPADESVGRIHAHHDPKATP